MYYTLTLNSRGQVTIPKRLREFLNVKPGSSIRIRAKDDTVTIKKALTLDEMLADLDEIRARLPQKTKAAIKRHASKTVRELRAIADEDPETIAYYRRKYLPHQEDNHAE